MDTKLKIGLIIMLSWINLTANGMSEICSDSLTLIIKEDAIQISEGDTISLSIEVRNSSSINYLLYAFQKIEEGATTVKTYCDGNKTAGMAVIIEKDGKQLSPYLFSNFEDDAPVLKDDIVKVIERVRKSYLSKKLLLKQGSIEMLNLSLDISKFELTPGYYKLTLLYYCGNNLKNIVSKDIQDDNMIEYDALIYNGCLKSNKIDLYIK